MKYRVDVKCASAFPFEGDMFVTEKRLGYFPLTSSNHNRIMYIPNTFFRQIYLKKIYVNNITICELLQKYKNPRCYVVTLGFEKDLIYFSSSLKMCREKASKALNLA